MRTILITALMAQLVGAAPGCVGPDASCGASAQTLLQLTQQKEARAQAKEEVSLDYVEAEADEEEPTAEQETSLEDVEADEEEQETSLEDVEADEEEQETSLEDVEQETSLEDVEADDEPAMEQQKISLDDVEVDEDPTMDLPGEAELLAISVREISSSGNLSTEMQEVLDWHNTFRCMHNVSSIEWDATIAANAQAWADNGVYEHSSDDDRTLEGYGKLGENLAWGSPSRTGAHSTKAWYWEVNDTDGSPENCSDTVPADSGAKICHYTQVVWAGSTKLGCGKGRATYNGTEGDFIVCQYSPAGNVQSQFSDNVNAAVNTQHACETGTATSPPTTTTTTTTTASGGAAVGATCDCVDKPNAPTDCLHVTIGGSPASCGELAGYCSGFDFVKVGCPQTCGSTCHCEDGAPTDSPAYTWTGTTTHLTCAEMDSLGLCDSNPCVKYKCRATCNFC